jgi:hypothetical protein
MKRNELKKMLKPLIKECIKEVIFEDGTLSGIISEVAKGLTSTHETAAPIREASRSTSPTQSVAVLEAKRSLDETKRKLQESTGLKGVFENTTPMRGGAVNESSGPSGGALRDRDPQDPGVDITGIMKIAGGAWNQLK